jgi:hypothetical protein
MTLKKLVVLAAAMCGISACDLRSQQDKDDITVLGLACDRFLLAFEADGPWTQELREPGPSPTAPLGQQVSIDEALKFDAVLQANRRAKAIEEMRSACDVDLLKIPIE